MLKLDIITPEKRILTEENISLVSVDTVEGQIGILPRHSALYSMLKPSELKYVKDGQSFFVAIHGGFIQVAQDTVTILADDARRAEDINEQLAEEARQKATDVMAQRTNDADFAMAEVAMRKALLELKVSRKKRNI